MKQMPAVIALVAGLTTVLLGAILVKGENQHTVTVIGTAIALLAIFKIAD